MWGSVGLFVKLIKLAPTGRGWDWDNIPCTFYTPCHDSIDERDEVLIQHKPLCFNETPAI